MNPAYKSDKPGKAPDGMDLVPVYDDAGTAAPSSDVAGYANVKLTPDRKQLIGVQTGMTEMRSLGRSVRTVGRVAVDETRLYKISTKFDGYIDKLYVNVTGQPVRKGQPLFSVYSPDLLATQQEYLLAMRAAKQSPSLLAAARQRLLLWDITPADIDTLERTGAVRKSLTIDSPVTGFVLNKIAVQGAVSWPSQFSVGALGALLSIMGNGLPAHLTGIFPIARGSDPAFAFDANPNAKTIDQMPLENFFIDYGKQDRKAGELVWRIEVPKLKAQQHFKAYKISKRFDQDISAVMGAFLFELNGDKIADVRICFGGMAATPQRALKTEAALKDKTLVEAMSVTLDDYAPISDMRASADYRRATAQALLLKALMELQGTKHTRVLA